MDARDSGPDAKVYRLTDAGRDALGEWARSPYEPSPRPMDPEFNLRFIFAGQLDRDLAGSVVRTELRYRLAPANPTGELPPTPADPRIAGIDPTRAREIHLLAHERGFASTAAHIAWLKPTLQRLERRP